METYNLAVLTKRLYESGLFFFSSKTLRDILEIKNETVFFRIINRLLKSGVLQKIERDKYLLKGARFSDFALANFLYYPSYVSFESALNFHGLLSQFPQETTSVTTKKTIRKIVEGKVFSYNHLQKKLFWGYKKKDDFLIAIPEKALLDQLYLAGRGFKMINLDEMDFSVLNKARLKQYFQLFPKSKQLLKIWRLLESYL